MPPVPPPSPVNAITHVKPPSNPLPGPRPLSTSRWSIPQNQLYMQGRRKQLYRGRGHRDVWTTAEADGDGWVNVATVYWGSWAVGLDIHSHWSRDRGFPGSAGCGSGIAVIDRTRRAGVRMYERRCNVYGEMSDGPKSCHDRDTTR